MRGDQERQLGTSQYKLRVCAEAIYGWYIRVCARVRAVVCVHVCVQWDEACVWRGVGAERRDIDSGSRLRSLGDARGKVGRAAGVRRGGCAPRFAWGSGMVRAGIGVWGRREAGSAPSCFKLSILGRRRSPKSGSKLYLLKRERLNLNLSLCSLLPPGSDEWEGWLRRRRSGSPPT